MKIPFQKKKYLFTLFLFLGSDQEGDDDDDSEDDEEFKVSGGSEGNPFWQYFHEFNLQNMKLLEGVKQGIC